MTTPSCFPELPFLHVEHVRKTIAGLTVVVRITTTTSICPVCGQASSRVHSRYTRTLADLPWSGRTVQLHGQVRRFFCINRSCPRTTFAEPLAALASRSARRTSRLTEMLSALALVTGGEAGERLSSRLGMYCSGPTLLRLLRRLPLPPAPPPHVIGLDDWAWHKNLRYGTIVVDLERRHPVALLPDRSASSVINWLQAHPQVDIVCRDRAEAFADAARTGAPHALQIADRWHVVSNLREALEKGLARHRTDLKHVQGASEGATSQPDPDQATTSPASPPSSPLASSRSRLATERAADLHPKLWRPQTWGLTHHLFVGKRTPVVERGMPPGPIIKGCDVIKGAASGLCSCLK
jgi:transposase